MFYNPKEGYTPIATFVKYGIYLNPLKTNGLHRFLCFFGLTARAEVKRSDLAGQKSQDVRREAAQPVRSNGLLYDTQQN
jgi:hypothetical protein